MRLDMVDGEREADRAVGTAVGGTGDSVRNELRWEVHRELCVRLSAQPCVSKSVYSQVATDFSRGEQGSSEADASQYWLRHQINAEPKQVCAWDPGKPGHLPDKDVAKFP